jgi:hypothetical protein
MKCLLAVILALFSAILLTEQPLRADGCFIPPPAFEVLPPIPAQRAVIAWDGKTETLLVESSLNAKGQSFGWIIPLPNVPTTVEKGTPDIINTLDLCCRPYIVTPSFGRKSIFDWSMILLFLFIPLAFIGKMIWKNQGLASRDIQSFIFCFLIVCVIAAMLLPALSKASAGVGKFADSQALVRLQAVVGNYEIAVLECQKTEDLDAWLETNGFAKLPPAGKPIVKDYINRKWCFVASKLQMEGDGPRAPHPLLFKFPVNAPVYPMKLTALANSPVYLKLFVIASQQAKIPSLRLDRVRWTDGLLNYHYYGSGERQEVPPVVLGPWLKQKNSIVTAATGIINPKSMNSDMEIGFKAEKRDYQRALYTHKAAVEKGQTNAYGVLLLGLILIMLGSPFYDSLLLGQLRGYRRFSLISLGILALITTAIVVHTYIYLDKVNDITRV